MPNITPGKIAAVLFQQGFRRGKMLEDAASPAEPPKDWLEDHKESIDALLKRMKPKS